MHALQGACGRQPASGSLPDWRPAAAPARRLAINCEWQWQVEAARPTARWGTYPPARPHLARCATSWQASGVRMVRYSGRTGAEILTPPMT